MQAEGAVYLDNPTANISATTLKDLVASCDWSVWNVNSVAAPVAVAA